MEYREGIFVGYRYYDTCKVKPLFCFGHGLSYTDFSYEEITVDRESMRLPEKRLSSSISMTARPISSAPIRS